MNTNSHIENVFNNMINDVNYCKWASYTTKNDKASILQKIQLFFYNKIEKSVNN